MKKISFLLLSASMLVTVLWSCKKDEQKVVFENGTSPVLTSTTATNVPLSYTGASSQAINLTWTNPNYQLNTGLSSYNVSYQVEIDTAGANFTNPNKKVISITNDLGLSMSQSDFNDLLLNQLQLAPAVAHNVEVRVKSYLVTNTGVQYSNVLKFTATPYSIPPKVTPPTSGSLYIVGDATSGGWDNPISATYLAAQQFIQVSPTLYRIPSIALVGGKDYKFIAVNGSWADQWSVKINEDPKSITGGDIVFNAANVKAPPISGNYKIEVDFQRGKFTVTQL